MRLKLTALLSKEALCCLMLSTPPQLKRDPLGSHDQHPRMPLNLRRAHPGLLLALLAAPLQVALSQTGQRERPTPAPLRPSSRFTLTPTQNLWVSLLLDSSNGRIWQVHFSVSDSALAGRVPLNEDPLAPPDSAHAGRFSLQETSNIFTFLLLDHDDGRVWQVQWSNDADKRGIVRVLSKRLP
ncbi:MAG TPA: hypothetical protein VGV12_12070 [Gemmatimonadales bacterium]|nr:hypothetical protein [Gemmatimonadales bacterium]